MTDKEIYAQILAKVLIDAGASIIIGGEDSNHMIASMAEKECCKALREIRRVLDDHALDDRDCFDRIEKNVSVCEGLEFGGGSRHDFG